MKKIIQKFIPVLSLILAIYMVFSGFVKYGFWVNKGPGGGFMPILGGIIVIIFSILILLESKKDDSDIDFTWKALVPAGALLALVLCSYVVGMVISMALYIFIWLRFVEKHKVTSSLYISLSCTVVVYFIFVIWLSVPMPKGLLGIL